MKYQILSWEMNVKTGENVLLRLEMTVDQEFASMLYEQYLADKENRYPSDDEWKITRLENKTKLLEDKQDD